MVRHLTMTQALALKDHAIAACAVYPGEVLEGMPEVLENKETALGASAK